MLSLPPEHSDTCHSMCAACSINGNASAGRFKSQSEIHAFGTQAPFWHLGSKPSSFRWSRRRSSTIGSISLQSCPIANGSADWTGMQGLRISSSIEAEQSTAKHVRAPCSSHCGVNAFWRRLLSRRKHLLVSCHTIAVDLSWSPKVPTVNSFG